ncbi:MAG: Kelch repeat-containing protein, partial [Gemmatimonadales bacterium]
MVYFPPVVAAPATFHVKVTSVADPSKSSTCTVTINPPPGSAPFTLPATSMATTRLKHSAVALADGRILITGGASDARNNNNTTVAELYLPATATFQTLANPTVKARNDHTATLLADGRVLLAGGDTGFESPDRASAEVFDPSLGTFTAAANMMSIIRGSGHRALRLESGPHAGKVLVMGGAPYYYISDATASADLYNPATNTFSPAPNPMQDARTRFTLTRLQDGRYLVAGGSRTGNDPDLATAEIFNPVDMTFTRTTGNLSRRRFWHTPTLLNSGKVLIAGGYDGEDRAELFDPATGLFTELAARLKEGREFHTATLMTDGKVHLAGGRNTYFYRVLG